MPSNVGVDAAFNSASDWLSHLYGYKESKEKGGRNDGVPTEADLTLLVQQLQSVTALIKSFHR
jgi:hypothetical protein